MSELHKQVRVAEHGHVEFFDGANWWPVAYATDGTSEALSAALRHAEREAVEVCNRSHEADEPVEGSRLWRCEKELAKARASAVSPSDSDDVEFNLRLMAAHLDGARLTSMQAVRAAYDLGRRSR
jgi:hypothetical protein